VSDIGIRGERTEEGGFRRGTVLLIILVGIIAFVAMLVLGAYAPELRSGKNGGAHALSNAATGYSGLVRLAEATGRNPQILRHDYLHDSEDLVVLTPESGATDLTDVLGARETKPTLLVFPKWNAQRDPNKPAWVRVRGLLPRGDPEGVLAPATKLAISRRKTGGEMLVTLPAHAVGVQIPSPPVLQTASGDGLQPIVTDAAGRIVLARIGETPLYVLADADLLNNHGIADPHRAAAALALLDFLGSTDPEAIYFDVTLNGLGSSKSPLKLMFDPPFLAVTVAIAAALLLAGLQALARFGVPLRPQRAIAFGKAALVDNSAALVRKAGREARLGNRYAEIVRERVAALLRLPPTMPAEKVEQRLDALATAQNFSTLAADAANAGTPEGVLAAARALHQWQQEAIK